MLTTYFLARPELLEPTPPVQRSVHHLRGDEVQLVRRRRQGRRLPGKVDRPGRQTETSRPPLVQVDEVQQGREQGGLCPGQSHGRKL